MNEQFRNPVSQPPCRPIDDVTQGHGERTFSQYLMDRLNACQVEQLTPEIAAQELVLLLADCIEGVDPYTGQLLPERLQVGKRTSATVKIGEKGVRIENMDGLMQVLGGIGVGLFNRAYGLEFADYAHRTLFSKPTV